MLNVPGENESAMLFTPEGTAIVSDTEVPAKTAAKLGTGGTVVMNTRDELVRAFTEMGNGTFIKQAANMNKIRHPFGPLFSEDSRILILGSFPSVKSREQMFYYGHPQNRFWRVTAAIFGQEMPETIEAKKALILRNGLALWDSIASCEIKGSSDSSIKNAKVNDLSLILETSSVERILCNGKKSYELYVEYIEPVSGIRAECLPSTSPANAVWTLDKLIDEWGKALSG